ncbi:MAG: undecaprenyl-diphosphate phosphatase [Actinobacteria bacterium]|nr:MAG: undecaprenyl-diphosphate phosphatase [Actinomycetota bacterium]
MTIVQTITLGAVQGITEFLPISSSAHLVLIPRLLNWNNLGHQNTSQVYFDVVLHLGSLIALLLYFRKDLVDILKNQYAGNNKFLMFLFLGTLPIVFVGLLLGSSIENIFKSANITALLLIFTGLLILFSEIRSRLNRNIVTMKAKDSITIGIAQAFALAPGISRSGATISAGLLLGLNREAAARFSFLLAIPAIIGSLLVTVFKAGSFLFSYYMLAGLVSSFIFSYLAISFLIGYLKKGSLFVFAAYCLSAGLLFLIIL